MPGNFQAVPEKICVVQKPGIIYQSPDIFKKKSNFLIFMGIFTNFDKYICIKRVQFLSEIGFYDVKYQNLRPIFTAARKNIFGKVVTLFLFCWKKAKEQPEFMCSFWLLRVNFRR